MTTKFDSLNDEFNVVDDIVQPEVIERKIEKIKETSDDIKKELSETSKDKHIRIICPAVEGAGHDNRLISFLHVNKDTPNGYIIEYVEEKTGNISH